MGQTAIFVVLVRIEFTERFNVAILSQPTELVRVSLYEPAEVILRPFQLYGSWFAQMAILVVLVRIEFTDRFSVVMLSQPAELVRVSL